MDEKGGCGESIREEEGAERGERMKLCLERVFKAGTARVHVADIG